ncbi:MAG: DNA alkylation repair protein [Clostridiales bacterium]|nr:DNA alkylation repair protein [Clostridiales bacterium]
MTTVQNKLFEMQDEGYLKFNSKLIPNISPDTMIGVRTPELRKFAKEAAKMPECAEFLETLPHEYYDENNLHGFIIEQIKDYDEVVAALNRFLPYVDNWATCDLISPKCFKKHIPELSEQIKIWLDSGKTYTIRFAVNMLIKYFLDDNFAEWQPRRLAEINTDEYYIKMVIAWYFATALAKQYDAVIEYFSESISNGQHRLDEWTHNKALQKAIESYRISDETKSYLRTLKIRG